jgi:signal transduction histidine kinase/DNA-binding response OmpR family regulator
MFIILSLAGIGATVVLCGILTIMHRAKARSDDANRIQTSLLEKANAQAAAVSEAHKRAKGMLDTTPFGCKMWDKDLHIFDCNKAAVKLFGLKDEQEHMDRYFEMLPERQPDGSLSSEKAAFYVQKAFAEGRQVFEWMYQLPDGTPFPSEVTLVRVDYGKDVAVAGYIRDLREYKQMMAEIAKQAEKLEAALDEARNASKTKSEFLASMSHEIRTPMNAVIGMTELLLRSTHLSPHDMDCLNDINVSAHSLLHIINDILDMSKIESGKMELNPIHYDFKALMDNVTSMFKYVSNKKGIEFRLETEGTVPETLYGDDIRVRQIITNICGNAVKFTEKGSVTLKIIAPEEEEEPQTFTMEIKDTGMGIRKEDIPKLFSAFEQSKTEKNRYVAGTGLGLAISKSFVEMMGGNIRLDSEYGKGTVFTITIPLVKGDPSKVKHDDDVQALMICAPQARVLVVDDNEYNLKVAHGLLELFEIDTDTASSGKEAIKLVTENDYDIVFMDHMMPEMDGLDTTAAIRALGEKYSQLKIIALTANAVQGAKEMFLENGFNEFLSKPIEMSDLTKTLMAWLPADKITKKDKSDDDENKDDDIYESFYEALAKIEGIDVEIGLRRFNGLKKMYYDSLKLFYDRLLKDSEKLSLLMDEQNYTNFSISVHAIKSTLASIGSAEMSDTAFRLEMASKNDEIDYCVTHFPNFLNNLRSLHKQLSLVFPPDEPASEKKKGEEPLLRESLAKATDALDSYDNDAATEVLNGLQAYDFGEETNALLADTVAALKQYDFEGAKNILSKI